MKIHRINCTTHVSSIAEKLMVYHPYGEHVSFAKTNINYGNNTNKTTQHIMKIKLREGTGTTERSCEHGKGMSQ